jgi:transposase-like protein
MIIKIKCPACSTEGSISLVESSYQGPYRCWKCRALFTIKLENNELKSCQPLNEEEFERQQAAEAMKAKFKKKD